MNAGVSYPMIPGAVMGLATSDSLLLLKGYGFSDYKRKIAIDPNRTLFQVGSVGKVFTSIALLQQVEAGRISLSEDVNKYLDRWSIRNPFDQALTPFHLLTHSAGFNDRFIGYMAKNNAEVKSLGEHLPKNMPRLFKAPGTEINYSNYSYALAGHLVEKVTGNQFTDQIQQNIFDPLHLSSATYQLPDNYLQQAQYANGYLWRDTFVEKKMFPRHATPAGSMLATGKDMINFAQALLRRDPRLLKDASYDLLLTEQFTNHPKLRGYTIGMEVQNYHGQIAIAKGGQITGFLSVLILFPELDLALFLSTNTQTDNHFELFFKGLMNQFFPVRKPVAVSVPFDPNEYRGVYANERANHESLKEFFALFGGQFTLYVSDSGNLRAFHNGAWHEYTNTLEKKSFRTFPIKIPT